MVFNPGVTKAKGKAATSLLWAIGFFVVWQTDRDAYTLASRKDKGALVFYVGCILGTSGFRTGSRMGKNDATLAA
jgi:hypothetical protein